MSADTIPRAEHDALIRQAMHEARGNGERIGRREATERIRQILTLDVARGREPMALVLALDSDLTVEMSAKALAASPTAAAARPPLDARPILALVPSQPSSA